MWERTFDAPTAWYHMNAYKKRTNANAYYSPGVDRFFAVDSLDPYTAYEVAKILSSKMPAISVCILTTNDPTIDNTNCHEYTIRNKNAIQIGSSVLFNRQHPSIRKLPPESLEHVGPELSADYTGNENEKTFNLFKEYARFTIQVWHAAKICEMCFNYLPMEDYAVLFNQSMPEGFSAPADNANGELETGITNEIKKILYNSNSTTEALDSIAAMWRTNLTPHTTYWKDLFYKLIEVTPPADLTTSTSIEKYSGYLL
jgi:hypothetical protein